MASPHGYTPPYRGPTKVIPTERKLYLNDMAVSHHHSSSQVLVPAMTPKTLERTHQRDHIPATIHLPRLHDMEHRVIHIIVPPGATDVDVMDIGHVASVLFATRVNCQTQISTGGSESSCVKLKVESTFLTSTDSVLVH